MNRYRVEILGQVPNGLTHNDVFATVNSMLRDDYTERVESVTKRRLSGGFVSIVAVFEAADSTRAGVAARYAGQSVTGFSFDTMVRKCVGD